MVYNKNIFYCAIVVVMFWLPCYGMNNTKANLPCVSFCYDEKAGMYVLQRTKKVNMAMKAVIVAEFGLSAALLIDCSRDSKSKESLGAALFAAVAVGVGYSLVQDVLDEYYNNQKEQPE